MKNRLVRTLLFFLIFIALFSAFTQLLIPKDNSTEAGIHYELAKGFLAEPAESLDVLILGDSEAYTLAIPLEIWAETGITVYSVGTPDQKLYETESYLKRFFENQSPKLVLLETNVFYRVYSTLDIVPHMAQEWFPLLRYHDRWKDFSFSELYRRVQFQTPQRNRGYNHTLDVIPADTTGYMAPSEEISPISRKNLSHIYSILNLCREEGAQLVLISSPSTINWSYSRHNQVALLCQDLGLEYIDLNLCLDEIQINWQIDTCDAGDHLNYWGAKKVSGWLSDYLTETGLFEDKRHNPAYDRWNQDLEGFRAETASIPD